LTPPALQPASHAASTSTIHFGRHAQRQSDGLSHRAAIATSHVALSSHAGSHSQHATQAASTHLPTLTGTARTSSQAAVPDELSLYCLFTPSSRPSQPLPSARIALPVMGTLPRPSEFRTTPTRKVLPWPDDVTARAAQQATLSSSGGGRTEG
jgi:hypothetical protein